MSRDVKIRYELMRGGAFCALLRAQARTGKIRVNSADRLKSLLTATFSPVAYDVDGRAVEIDVLNDEIRPILSLDGVEHPLGVYVFAKPQNAVSGPVESLSVSAYDRTKKVADTNSENYLFFQRATAYLSAIEGLLTQAGISTVFKTASSALFQEAREDWPPGTSYLDIINKLLGELAYNPLWFDAEGSAHLEPSAVPNASAVTHVLDTADPETRVVAGYMTRTRDLFSAPNVFKAICQNPDKSVALSATAVNDNPQSPLSIPRRGRRIAKIVYVDNTPGFNALQATVNRMRDESLLSGEIIEVETGLQPGWGVGDVVALTDKGKTDICVSRSFTMDLRAGGTMHHKLEKVVYQLD